MIHLLNRILLATDGSGDARLAALAATSLSEKAGAELHVVHAWQSVPHPIIDLDYYEEGARRTLEEETSFVSGAGDMPLIVGAVVSSLIASRMTVVETLSALSRYCT